MHQWCNNSLCLKHRTILVIIPAEIDLHGLKIKPTVFGNNKNHFKAALQFTANPPGPTENNSYKRLYTTKNVDALML